MAQQLPLIQIPMPQRQIIGDINPQDYANLQRQGLADIQPDQNLIAQSMANQDVYNLPPLQRPQEVVVDVSPQTMAVAGANRGGVDWRGALGTLAGYAGQIGQGMAGAPNISQGLASGMSQGLKHQQNINQYNTMKPYYQQMGYDVDRLDPRRGGAGIATTPAEMVDLQSKIAERDYLNDYRQTMAQARAAQALQTAGTKGVTIGTLRMMSPQFKKMIDAQYGFGSGQNLKLLDQIVPASMVQGYMPAVTKTSNMVYSGGLHSSQNKTGRSDIYHHSDGGKGKGKPNAHTW